MSNIEEARAAFIAARGGGARRLGGQRVAKTSTKVVNPANKARSTDAKVWSFLHKLQLQPLGDVSKVVMKKLPMPEGTSRPDGEKEYLVIDSASVQVASQSGITVIEGLAREADESETSANLNITPELIQGLKNMMAQNTEDSAAAMMGTEQADMTADDQPPPLMAVNEVD